MTRHDDSWERAQALIRQIDPSFAALTADLAEVSKEASNPAVMAVLLYKLVQERQRTNELLAKLEKHYEDLDNRTKGTPTTPASLPNGPLVSILPEQDQHIMQLVNDKGHTDAAAVKEALGYKHTNAASQRLNALVRNGHLQKVQSGKKVVFVPRNG